MPRRTLNGDSEGGKHSSEKRIKDSTSTRQTQKASIHLSTALRRGMFLLIGDSGPDWAKAAIKRAAAGIPLF